MIKNIFKVFIFFSLVSCVPTKNIVYLQGTPLLQKEIKRINNNPYRLQVDDNITIDIKSVDEKLVAMFQKNRSNSNSSSSDTNVNQIYGSRGTFFSSYRINNHGNIRLPKLGEINVLGYTTIEVRKKLEKEFLKYFKNKEDIFITVKLAGIKFTVIGEVANPGPKVIYQNKLHIIDAITVSGDITNVGNRKKVELIRTTISGQKKYYIDLTQIEAFQSEIFYIKPNDIINVLPLPQKALGIGTTGFQALSTAVSVLSLVTSLIIIAKNI